MKHMHMINHMREIAINLVASDVHQSSVAGRFDAEIKSIQIKSPCAQWGLKRSNTKTAHTRSMRLAGPKWLGRRMDAAWGSSGVQANTQTREVPQ